MDLLRQGREEEVAALAIADPRTLLPLMGRLWDPDPQIRRQAAGAIGKAAETHPTQGLAIVRRLMWALNDEAATNGVYGIAALGEIGCRIPEMLAPFVPALVAMAWDDRLRLELLRALSRVAEADPGLVARQLGGIEALVDGSREEERLALERLVAIAKGRDDDGN